MTSLPETSTVRLVTAAVAGLDSGIAVTAGTAVGTNVLTTLLDTTRATVRDELRGNSPKRQWWQQVLSWALACQDHHSSINRQARQMNWFWRD